MAGKILRAGTADVGKLPLASAYNTIEDREAYFAAFPREAAMTWWIDPELACVGMREHRVDQPSVPGGDLPNRTFFGPFDWPRRGQLLRTTRALRVVVAGSDEWNVYYPGDPDFTTPYNFSGYDSYLHRVPQLLFDTWGVALEAAVADSDVLFAFHQPWAVEDPEWGGLCRFLRALAPPEDEGLVLDDVLTLVFLFEPWVEPVLLGSPATGHLVDAHRNWNYYRHGGGPYADVAEEEPYDYLGLNATFAEDIGPSIAAFPRYGRSRTILYAVDPGTAAIDTSWGENGPVIEHMEITAANNALQLADMVAALGAYGFEDGGVLDPFGDPIDIVNLVRDHFGLD